MYTVFDPVAMAFYAVVCAGLAAFAPPTFSRVKRLALGAAVGVIAALLLPNVRQLFGL